MSGLSLALTRLRPDAGAPGLEELLCARVEAAQRAWPTVTVDPARFVAYLAERLPAQLPVAEALAAVHSDDLYLACACSDGATGALAVFDRELLTRLGGVARIDRSPDFLDEVRQRVRERLLVGPQPRIAEYNGSGPLAGWVRVVAMRVALNTRRDAHRGDRPQPSGGTGPGPDPELDVIHGEYRAEAETALRTALCRLDEDDRTVLRLHYLDGWTLEKIGRHYGIARSNASRRVAAARRFLLAETRRELERLAPAITTASRDSLLHALRSKIQLNLESVLKR